MRDGAEPLVAPERGVMPDSHKRILSIMALLGIGGSIAGAVFHSIGFGAGVLAGTALAFGNYFWLKHSLRKVFDAAIEGEKPKVSAIRYIGRYLTIGVVIAVIFITGVLPIVAVILGMAGFGFAVVVDGFFKLFTSIFSSKEI